MGSIFTVSLVGLGVLLRCGWWASTARRAVRDSHYYSRHDLGGSLALTGEVAFHSSNDILDLLKEHDISDVDVAYRESTTRDNNETLLIPYHIGLTRGDDVNDYKDNKRGRC